MSSSTPKAPTLATQTDAANANVQTAASDAQQTMNTAQTYNKNAQANLQGVTNQSNSSAGQLGAQANQNISTYGQQFVPLQGQEAQEAQAYGSQANVQKLQGMAVANSNVANQAARANSAAALASEGVDPASIHGAALDRQNSITGAANVAGASTQSALNTQNQAFNMTNTANQLGMQVGAQGAAGETAATNAATTGQNAINSTNVEGIGNLGAAANYLNAGTSANANAIGAATGGFSNQMTAANAQNSQDAGYASLVGAGVTAAAAFASDGGPINSAPQRVLNIGGSSIGHGARSPMPHSGLPVVNGHVRPRQAIPMSFEPMDAGGSVREQGALPIGTFPGTTDRKPAMLTPGEFVIPKDAVNHMGVEYWHKQVDKARENSNKRRAIPVQYQPHMSMR
jgi:hypothetical protein